MNRARLVLQVPGELTYYLWKNVDILVWDAAPSPGGIGQMTRAVDQLLREDKRLRSGVHFMTERSGPPEGEARIEFRRFGQTHRKSIACAAVVVEHRGFVAGAIKSAVTAMLLMRGDHLHTRLFSGPEEAAAWLGPVHAERSGVATNPAELLRILRTTRAEHAAPTAVASSL